MLICVHHCIKYVFCILNLILAGCGIYSMYTAVTMVENFEIYSKIIGNKYTNIFDVMIIVTAFLFLFSILEITCFWNAHYCNLITTGILNLLILISLLGAGIGVFHIIESQEFELIAQNIKQSIFNRYTDNYIRRTLDNLQEEYECCGALGPEDYVGDVPDSCCEYCEDGVEEYFSRGCAKVFSEIICESMNHISYICFALWTLLSFSTVITIVYTKILCD